MFSVHSIERSPKPGRIRFAAAVQPTPPTPPYPLAAPLCRRLTNMTQQNAQQNRQTEQNPVSSPTVKSRLNCDEKRKQFLKSLEADAEAFVNGFQAAKTINDEAQV